MPNTTTTIATAPVEAVTEAYYDAGIPTPEFSNEQEGINNLRRSLLRNQQWHTTKLAQVKIALELLEDDEAYNIYNAIISAR